MIFESQQYLILLFVQKAIQSTRYKLSFRESCIVRLFFNASEDNLSFLSLHTLDVPPFFACSIFTEERFEGLAKGIEMLNLLSLEEKDEVDDTLEESVAEQVQPSAEDVKGPTECSNQIPDNVPLQELSDASFVNNLLPGENFNVERESENNTAFDMNSEIGKEAKERESGSALQNDHNHVFDETLRNNQSESHLPDAVLPLVQHCQHERSKSLTR